MRTGWLGGMERPLRIESPGTSGRVTHRGRCRRGVCTPARRSGLRRTRRPRFLNRDPIEEAGGLNLYAFCGNDGVNGYDVLGMDGDTFDKLRRGDPVGGNGNSGGGTGNSDSESPSGKDRSPPGESKSDKSEPIFHLPPLIVRVNRGDDGSFTVEDRIQRYQNDLTMGQKRDDPNSVVAATRDQAATIAAHNLPGVSRVPTAAEMKAIQAQITGLGSYTKDKMALTLAKELAGRDYRMMTDPSDMKNK